MKEPNVPKYGGRSLDIMKHYSSPWWHLYIYKSNLFHTLLVVVLAPLLVLGSSYYLKCLLSPFLLASVKELVPISW